MYHTGESSSWEPRDDVAPGRRRVRYNAATGFHEVIGGGTPPAAYQSPEAAAASLGRPPSGCGSGRPVVINPR